MHNISIQSANWNDTFNNITYSVSDKRYVFE